MVIVIAEGYRLNLFIVDLRRHEVLHCGLAEFLDLRGKDSPTFGECQRMGVPYEKMHIHFSYREEIEET